SRWQHVLDFGEFREAVLAKGWERRSQFHGRTADELLAWLRTIGWSVAVDAWRQRKRHSGLLEKFQKLVSAAFVAPPSERIETQDLVEWLLAGLSERERKVLRMRYYEDVSTEKIAEALECSPEAVSQLHYRAIAKLREKLKKSGTDR